VLGPSHTESLGFLNPRGVVEVTLWVLMSLTAGFCEELVYIVATCKDKFSR